MTLPRFSRGARVFSDPREAAALPRRSAQGAALYNPAVPVIWRGGVRGGGKKGGGGGTLLATKRSRRLRSTTHRPHQHAPPPSLPLNPSGFPSGRWASTEEGARPGLNRGVMPSPHGKRLARVLARARLGYGAKTHARGGHRKGPSGNARGGGSQAPAPPPRTGLCRARGRCGRRFPRARHIHSMLDP